MNDVLNKNKSQILKIKDVCTKYFDKNDDAMKIMQDKVKIVDATFDEFMNNVVKPQQLGEARLFSVETRLKEEEDLRILELSHMKDIVKKLIFAIEQANLTAKDTYSSSNIDGGQPLPNLLKNSTLSAKHKVKTEKDSRVNMSTMQSRGFDILFIKRLMYLKNSIDDDKHIHKDQRETSNENLENTNLPNYPKTMSSALLSLKQGEQQESIKPDNMLISQGKFIQLNIFIEPSAEPKMFQKYQTSFSPQRTQTADKMVTRKDRIKKTAQNKSSSQHRNTGTRFKNTSSSNAFFVTQLPKDRKTNSKMNKTVMEESKTSTHRRHNKMDIEPVNGSYAVIFRKFMV
jgi:hypothetical protein